MSSAVYFGRRKQLIFKEQSKKKGYRAMKEFYYVGNGYLNNKYKEVYTRVSRALKIYYTFGGRPYFNFKGKRYKIDDFINQYTARPYDFIITADDGEKVKIDGYQADVYFKPYFIELIDDCCIRLYQYETTEMF